MKNFIKNIYLKIFQILPHSRVVDNFIAYFRFISQHKRLPNRKLFNDVLLRIKTSNEIFDILRQYTTDKEFVKEYVKEKVSLKYVVPTVAILRNLDDIENYKFSIGDVVKPTHSSGQVLFVGKGPIDKDKIKSWLSINYYNYSREGNYRYLKPKVIVEENIFGKSTIYDLKVFCVRGIAKVFQVDFDRFENHTRLLFDRNWNNLKVSLCYPISSKTIVKPRILNEIIEVAEKLANPFNFVRIDLIYSEGSDRFFVGEITHCHGSSLEKFNSEEAEEKVSKILFNN